MNIIDIAKGNSVSLTPDGPKGPRNKLKPGAVVAAQRAQVPIQFLKICINHKYVFPKSWDKFELPYPFTIINITISQPFFVATEASRDQIEAKIILIENEMNNG